MSSEYTVETFVKVNSLVIASEVRGARIPVDVEGAIDCEIEFPSDQAGNTQVPAADARPRYAYRLPADSGLVTFVKVRCRLMLDDPPAFPDNAPTREFWDWTHTAIDQARQISFTLVSRIIQAARADGQYWLAAPGEQPIHIGRISVFDEHGIDHIPPRVMFAVDTARVIQPDAGRSLEAIVGSLQSQLLIDRSAELLADAKYFALAAETQNLGLGVVLGAMACEVGIKQALRDLAGPDRVDLVEAIIANPREVTMAALDLYNTGLKAVVGRSLRVDHRETFKRVGRLFEYRNRYVHRGAVEPTSAEVLEVLDAATFALSYLAELAVPDTIENVVE